MKNSGPVTFEYGEVFIKDGFEWRITCNTDTFIIATRTDVVGEPTEADQIIQVMR